MARTSRSSTRPSGAQPSAAAILNSDLTWEHYENPAMREAARDDPAAFKNVAYYPPYPGGKTFISDAFWKGDAIQVTLQAGSYLYRFNDSETLANYGGSLSGWWTPYHELGTDAGFLQRLKLAHSLGVTFREWGRLTSAISEDWGGLSYLLIAKTKVPMKVFFGGFAAQDRLHDKSYSKRVLFDPATGRRLLTELEVNNLKQSCATPAPATPSLNAGEKAFLLKQWKELYESGAISSPTSAELNQSGVTEHTGPAPTPLPPVQAASRGSLTRGTPQSERRGGSKKLPGGGRQFYIPNLKTTHVDIVYARDIRVQPPASQEIERWWFTEKDAQGRTAPR